MAFALATVWVQAQPNFKSVDTKAARSKAAAALQNKSAQQGMRNTNADDCGAYTQTLTDKNGTSYQAGKDYVIVSADGATGFALSISNFMLDGAKYINIVGVTLEKAVCLEKTNPITITFENGESIVLYNFQNSNCDGVFQTFIGKELKNENVLELLKTQKLKSIKIAGVEKTVAASFSGANQTQVQGIVKCL